MLFSAQYNKVLKYVVVFGETFNTKDNKNFDNTAIIQVKNTYKLEYTNVQPGCIIVKSLESSK